MSERNEGELRRTGLGLEQLVSLTGLTVVVKPSAWTFWRDALPNGPEEVEVKVARIELGNDGSLVALGVRHAEMVRTITESGDPESPAAQLVAIQPERIMLFTPDGTDTYPPLTLPFAEPRVRSDVDPFDVPYI